MEKVIGESVKQTNQTFLRRYVDDYCKALDENFKQDTIRSLEHNIQHDPECTTVHSFIDRNTGDVYKPASWKAPAKHVRYSFSNKQDMLFLTDPRCVGWAGGYLYMR